MGFYVKKKATRIGAVIKAANNNKPLYTNDSKDNIISKEELKQLKDLRREKKLWENELLWLNCKQINNTDDTEQEAIKEAEKQIKELLDNVLRLEMKCFTFITNIEDSFIRQIFYMRYIRKFSWNRIASFTGGYNTADSIRKLHNRYLDKLNKNR